MKRKWTIDSWRQYPIQQQPKWSNKNLFIEVIDKLNKLPALVFSGETRELKNELKKINKNKGFLLQAGHCSESFDYCNGPKIHNFLRIILQMATVLEFNTNMKIIKIGRIAGQYAKPRSSDFEIINGNKVPSYRGDMVNNSTKDLEARTPNPNRLLEGYFRSAATLNLIRAFIQGGYSNIRNFSDWKEHLFKKEVSNLKYYRYMENELTNSLEHKNLSYEIPSNDKVYISHEALLLDYEEAFTRIDTTSGDYYSTSAHNLWIGNRTRQSEGAHVEFASGIGNPVGIKIGTDYSIKEIIKIIKKINPDNEDGKIILISRMGYENIETKLKPLIKAIKDNELEVTWCCDPMHGNTFNYDNYKVRNFDHIVSEISSFFKLCRVENIVPGGVHLEITGENVTECIGGINGLTLSNLADNYESKVDPRLNAAQALEIAFIIRKLLNESN